MVIPAAPAPFIIALHYFTFFYVNFNELISAANVIIAVPCWSSWKIGKIFLSDNPFYIEKHYGAVISSRLMALKNEATSKMAYIYYYTVSLLLMHIGTTSVPPNDLKSSDFPYITGNPALGPISP